jgi:hypothetical protein
MIWSAVGLTPLFVRRARCSPNPKSFKCESKSGGEPTALHSKTPIASAVRGAEGIRSAALKPFTVVLNWMAEVNEVSKVADRLGKAEKMPTARQVISGWRRLNGQCAGY